MAESEIIEWIDEQPWIETAGEKLHEAAHTLFPGGPDSQPLEDVLHGTWLGHPLHPVMTDIPIGSWTVALALDALDAGGQEKYRAAADAAVTLGLVGAVGTAVTGIVDWKYTKGHSRKVGVAHALLNSTATVLYTASMILRKKGARRAGQVASTLGYAAVSAGAWLGGHLVYTEHVGVDHATRASFPEDWVPVMAEDRLAENELTRVEADGAPVLLVKRGKWITALAETCAHMGGPLSEGELHEGCVTCPWHGSTFSLDDGGVVNGPSAFPQPALDVRVMHGQIEVRRAK